MEDVEILARRESASASAILARPELRHRLDDPALNPAERAAAVRRLLKGWVTPRLSAALAAFQEALSRLGLQGHSRLRLQPPPAFEGPDFHLEIIFRDARNSKPSCKRSPALPVKMNFPPDSDVNQT